MDFDYDQIISTHPLPSFPVPTRFHFSWPCSTVRCVSGLILCFWVINYIHYRVKLGSNSSIQVKYFDCFLLQTYPLSQRSDTNEFNGYIYGEESSRLVSNLVMFPNHFMDYRATLLH